MRAALLVGIDNYTDSPLQSCIKDATAMKTVLEKNGNGSPNFETILKTDMRKPLTKDELRGQIKRIFERELDVALFYFAGHGHANEYGGYLVTSDYQQHDAGISMDEILVMANRSKSKDKVIILDCCYSGQFGNPAIDNGRVTAINSGVSVLAASRANETAREDANQGVFTSLVLDALQGGAADLQGHITPGGLYAYVDKALGALEQRPIFKTNVSRFTSLGQAQPPIAPEVVVKITEYFVTPEYQKALDPSYEFTHELAIPENVAVMKDLQKMVAVGLVVPVSTDHMYFAAIKSTACRLTAMGYQYWRLVKENKFRW